ncbi:HTTM domain-containing protein [Psychroflexus sp. YR1-1]|uniref:HTTM domain-containing protein n=1 Tax=Psychroflexus aurantiacus TaxID=2709310 RepID=A0A6B3R485_9FLAO|nr:HTTM domain-containing protein [Psychroflexus aurantiacus]NEV93715.1 HTTM domain-containing protein [Psychroflexus aurantiacus]
MLKHVKAYFNQQNSAAPLAVFRIGFGLMMLISIIRFWSYGWIEKLYLDPKFHFSYYGFEWIKPIGDWTYLIFILCGLSALCVALGLKYRLAIILFFLSFTYIELMDKTTYLNHYYFISLVSFLMIFLPASAFYSIDTLFKKKQYLLIPQWTIDSIKLLLALVYFYAGLAKLNSDWLFKAMPLKIWLPSKYGLPFIGGNLMQQEWFHFAMSWSGMLYDLFIPFLLLYKRTRIFAFALVVFFHVFTRVLFPIGMFPYIMIIGSLVFFDPKVHHKIIRSIQKFLKLFSIKPKPIATGTFKYPNPKIIISGLAVFFVIQMLLPFRYVLYPSELFWREEGYRFSWRVMLMEKRGYANFKVVNPEENTYFYVDNTDFLSSFQEKQMSTQPDFILEYAHFLGEQFKAQGHEPIEIYVESYVALNGRKSQPFIDPDVDLLKQYESFQPKSWILPLNDDIKGL